MKYALKCCGKSNPIGVDRDSILLHFEVLGKAKIYSYSIHIATTKEKLESQKSDIGVWKREVKDAFMIKPEAFLFKQRTGYYWRVIAETSDGTDVSETAYFETGIEDWCAKWIKAPVKTDYVENFIKSFYVEENTTDGRLYICGLGYFDVRINGKRLDNLYYKPLVTDYAEREHPENHILYKASGHRATYYSYDISAYLKKGENILSVDLASGYYFNTEKAEIEGNFSFGEPRLIYEICLMDKNGERLIFSDENTLCRKQNYKSLLYSGDYIDFTAIPEPYQKSCETKNLKSKLVSPLCEGDTVQKCYFPVDEKIYKNGILYDFGENHTGGLEFTADAMKSGEIRIFYAEVLEESGEPNFQTSMWKEEQTEQGKILTFQENRYRLKEGENEIQPLFSWRCYRYVWIQKPDYVKIRKIQSLFIHTELTENGFFSCSNETLNKLNRVFLQTLYCNMHSGLITDCPHREKLPYTGDGHITMKAVCYNTDAIYFYRKWFEDILDSQAESGLIPNSAPHFGGGGGYAWGNAICFVTKYLYLFTGDKEIAERGYEAIKKWLGYYESKRDENYLIYKNDHSWMLGDWLAPETIASDNYYINTVCYLLAVEQAVFLAKELNKTKEEQETLLYLQTQIKKGINQYFFDKEHFFYGNGVQGEDVLALAAGVVPKEYEAAICKRIENHYRIETEYHLDTGIVLTPILIEYLTNSGYEEIAYRIMTAKTYPSYYSLMENETTLAEHWSKKWPDYHIGDKESRLVKGGGDLSHCHPMYGSVVSWLYERVAGLDLTGLYKQEIYIRPYFTEYLQWAEAKKILSYGETSVRWEHKDEQLVLEIQLPDNLKGIVRFYSHHKKLQNIFTGAIFSSDKKGYFHIELDSGNWILKSL